MSARILRSPNDAGGGARRGWRGKQKTANGSSGNYWSRRGKPSGIAPKTKHWATLLFLCLAAIGLLAFVIWSVLNVPTNTPLLAIGIYDYSEAIPPNALALEDVGLISETLDTKNIDPSQLERRPRGRASFLEELREHLQGEFRSSRQQNAIIYINAHGVTDDDGNPCLLLPESKPHDTKTWLPVTEILAVIQEEDKLANANKLLVLDCGRIRSDWSLGIVANDFTTQLTRIVNDAGVPKLHVLASTSGEHASFSAPELGSSSFAYFFAKALRGAASKSSKTKVTLGELIDYLQRHVDTYAQRYRGTEQVPVIIPELTDSEKHLQIVHVTGYEPPSITPLDSDALLKRHAKLDEIWRKFEAIQSSSAYRFDSLGYATLQHRLKRLEILLTAGRGYDDEFESTLAAAHLLADRIEENQFIRGELGSLALAKQFHPPLNVRSAVVETRWNKWLEKRAAAAKPAPAAAEATVDSDSASSDADAQSNDADDSPKDDAEGADGSAAEAESTEPPPEEAPLPYPVVARFVWKQLISKPHANDEVDQLFEFLQEADASPEVSDAELQLAEILRKSVDAKVDPRWKQKALRTYALSQKTAASDDVRTRYWSQSTINLADERQRDALDRLIQGERDALKLANDSWSSIVGAADASYPRAADIIKQVSFSYDVRDRVWAMTPALAEWLLSEPGRCDVIDATTLSEIIADNHKLGSLLEKHPQLYAEMGASDRRNLVAIAELAQQVDAKFKRLLTKFDSIAGQLESQKSSAVSEIMHATIELLRTPLPTQYRSGLRRSYLANVFEKPELEGQAYDEAIPQVQDDLPHTQWLQELGTIAAIDILDRKSLGNSNLRGVSLPEAQSSGDKDNAVERTTNWVKELGKELRHSLAEIQQNADELSSKAQAELQNTNPKAERARELLSQGSRLYRAAGGLLPGYNAENDVSGQLNALERCLFLQWHAERTLADQWGPTFVKQTVNGEEQTTYFAQLAMKQLAVAERTYRLAFTSPEATRLFNDCRDRIVKTQGRLVRWEALEPKDITDAGDRFSDLVITATDTESIDGRAAYFVSLPDVSSATDAVPLFPRRGSSPIVRRRGAETDGVQLKNRIETDERLLERGQLLAVAEYRGHRYSLPFYLGKEQPGPITTYERLRSPNPTVTVTGNAKKIQVVFVLDCSGSMGNRHIVGGKERRRLDIAKEALTDLAGSLDPRRYEASLILYGHRLGYEKGPGAKIRTNPNFEIPKIDPGEDVAVAIPMQQVVNLNNGFQFNFAAELGNLLGNVEPLGLTPLYMSLIEAYHQFKEVPGERYIIAITDGLNEQWKAPAASKRSANDVARAHDRKTQVHIIGFAVTGNIAPLQQICSNTGGQFHSVKNPSQLKKTLADAIWEGEFRVQANRFSKTSPISQPIEVKEYEDRKANYRVTARARNQQQVMTDVQLKGGEAIQLTLRDDQLIHHRYDHSLLDSGLAGGRKYFIGGHLPRNFGSSVAFDLSIQNADEEKFSPRPAEVWAEVSPRGDRDYKYVASEAMWLAGKPVPVARFQLSNWPQEARDADVQVWFTMRKPTSWTGKANVNLDAEEVDVQLNPDTKSEWTIKAIQQRNDEPLTIVLTERGSQHFVRIITQSGRDADVVSHRSLSGNKTKHEFQFNSGVSLGDRIGIRVLNRDDIKRNWIAGPKLQLNIEAR